VGRPLASVSARRSATAVIRSMLYQMESVLPTVSREAGVPLAALKLFLDEAGGLTSQELRRLAAFLWQGDRVFDDHVSGLRDSAKPPAIKRGACRLR
jgi:hypothetical protein